MINRVGYGRQANCMVNRVGSGRQSNCMVNIVGSGRQANCMVNRVGYGRQANCMVNSAVWSGRLRGQQSGIWQRLRHFLPLAKFGIEMSISGIL